MRDKNNSVRNAFITMGAGLGAFGLGVAASNSFLKWSLAGNSYLQAEFAKTFQLILLNVSNPLFDGAKKFAGDLAQEGLAMAVGTYTGLGVIGVGIGAGVGAALFCRNRDNPEQRRLINAETSDIEAQTPTPN